MFSQATAQEPALSITFPDKLDATVQGTAFCKMPHWHKLPATRFWGLFILLVPPATSTRHSLSHVLKTCILNDGAHFSWGEFSLSHEPGPTSGCWWLEATLLRPVREENSRSRGRGGLVIEVDGVEFTKGSGLRPWQALPSQSFYSKNLNIMLPMGLHFQVIKYNSTLILYTQSQEHISKVWPQYLFCPIKILSHHPWEVPPGLTKTKPFCPSYLFKESWPLSRESSLKQIPFTFPIN